MVVGVGLGPGVENAAVVCVGVGVGVGVIVGDNRSRLFLAGTAVVEGRSVEVGVRVWVVEIGIRVVTVGVWHGWLRSGEM